MIKNLRCKAKLGKAMKVECAFRGDAEDYAMAWLNLTNNARECPDIFLKHYNNSGCGVTVITPEKHVDEMKRYLEGLTTYRSDGKKAIVSMKVEVLNIEPVQTITPLLDWYGEEVEDDYAEVLPYDDLI